jgi:pimeloyl-ACP methyl ester carboxylesterase
MSRPSRGRRRRQVEANLPPPSALLLALEWRALLEWASLPLLWPFLKTAPNGDGHPVLVLPGLIASDTSTWPLRRFLEQRGYAAYPWELGANVGPRDGVVRRLVDRVRRIERDHGRRLSLIGWSLGGTMARALAVRMPDKVRTVITLGSPLGGHPRGTNAWRLFELVSGLRADDPRLTRVMERQPPVPHTSILSKSDGIVNWRMSLAPALEQTENIEVTASHFGLGVHAAVLWAIADRLAQPDGQWRPFDHNGWRSVFFRKLSGFAPAG